MPCTVNVPTFDVSLFYGVNPFKVSCVIVLSHVMVLLRVTVLVCAMVLGDNITRCAVKILTLSVGDVIPIRLNLY